MNDTIYASSKGPYYVRPTVVLDGIHSTSLTICQADTHEIIAVVPPRAGHPNYGDAALLSTSWNMEETLIAIQTMLMTSKETVDLEEINEMISQCFEKIHTEADV